MSRTAKGTFAPGSSGNPQGRKPGSGKAAALRQSIEASVPEILEALTKQALAGDSQAARLLLERALPPLRPEERPAELDIDASTDLATQGRAIVAATAAGRLAPAQATALLGGLSALAKLVETTELARRLDALEERVSGSS